MAAPTESIAFGKEVLFRPIVVPRYRFLLTITNGWVKLLRVSGWHHFQFLLETENNPDYPVEPVWV